MNIDVLKRIGFEPGRIVVNGGGAKSPLWCQIISNIVELPVEVPRVTEAVSLGLFMLAHVALGHSPSIHSATKKFIGINRKYRPSNSDSAAYKSLYKRFKKLIETLEPFFESVGERG